MIYDVMMTNLFQQLMFNGMDFRVYHLMSGIRIYTAGRKIRVDNHHYIVYHQGVEIRHHGSEVTEMVRKMKVNIDAGET